MRELDPHEGPFAVVQDDSSNYYVIPTHKVDDWYAGDMFDYEVAYAMTINGALSRLQIDSGRIA